MPSLRTSNKAARRSIDRQVVAITEEKALLNEYWQGLLQYETSRRGRHWPMERAVIEGYERIVWVFKAVTTIGADQARLPYRLRQGGEVLDDHPLYRVLNKRANPLETGQEFRKRLSAQVLLSKEGAFVEKTLSNGGTIKRLDLLPPDRTRIVPGDGDNLVSHVELTRRGGGIREIPWDKVLWFRGHPHPLDAYSGVTPLEAAGMSVELDYFARLYNVSFMRNDGRPGGILGVRNSNGTAPNDMQVDQMDRIESRFGRGPVEAGKLSVIGGELSYVDLGARPRDMQYGTTSKNAKNEILSAFGTPESVFGYAADRTFANAEAELYVYWTITMAGHNEIIVSGFDEDSDDDLEGFLDTSKVEVLQKAEASRREEARKEFDAGLRTLKSYADLAGYGDEIEDMAWTRALYVPQGRTPMPSREEDAETLGLSQPAPAVPPPAASSVAAPGAAAAALQAAPGAADVVSGSPQDHAGPVPTAAPSGPAAAEVSQGAGSAAGAALAAAATGGKHLSVVTQTKRAAGARMRVERLPATADEVVESSVDDRTWTRLEDTLTSALTALSTRWTNRAIARLESPKSRKGTRHWTAASSTDSRGGTKALDAARAVDADTWSAEAEVGTEPIITAAAVAAAAALLADFGGQDDEDHVAEVVAAVVAAVVAWIARSAAASAQRLATAINDADQDGAPLAEIVRQVRESSDRYITKWAEAVAVRAATATINGARDAAAIDFTQTGEITPTGHDADAGHAELADENRPPPAIEMVPPRPAGDITRTWLSRRDDRTRHTHGTEGADGQQQPLGQPFIVGDALLRFPGDPLGPPSETFNCRCRLLHRHRRSGRWASPLDVAS